MAHKRIKDVREKRIKPGQLFGQDATHMDMLMHHQRISTDIIRLHEPVQDTMDPTEMAPVQVHCAGDGSAEIKNQVREHDHVCFYADQSLRETDVGVDKVS